MRKFVSLVLALCLTLFVSACSRSTDEGNGYITKTFRIEQNTSLNSFLATVMKENKILEKHLPDDEAMIKEMRVGIISAGRKEPSWL